MEFVFLFVQFFDMEIKKFIIGPLGTNCYVLSSRSDAVILDPGGEVTEVIEALKGLNLKYIILSHYHFDHTLGVRELKQKFKNAKVLIHPRDKEYLDFAVEGVLNEGDKVQFGQEKLEVIHTPGHSAGGICLLGRTDIFSGDTIFADGMIGRTDLPGSDPRAMEKSLKKLKDITRPGMQVHPGHGREFSF